MKQKSLPELMRQAHVTQIRTVPMSRRERLERWAELLMREPDRQLRPLFRVEMVPLQVRRSLRQDDSPLAVAYADPILREQGLKGDSYGDIIDFFGLPDRVAHHLMCDCTYGGAVTAGVVAHHIGWIKDQKTFAEVCRQAWHRLQSGFRA